MKLMKKIVPPMVFVLALMGYSCSGPRCWTCEVEYVSRIDLGNGYTSNSFGTKDEKVCDMTRDEIREYEKQNTYDKGFDGERTTKCH